MRKITVERLAEFTERDYQLAFGISKDEFDQMLAALEEAYAREHKRKPRFTKITIKDKLILTLIYRHEYRSMGRAAVWDHPCGGAGEHAGHVRHVPGCTGGGAALL